MNCIVMIYKLLIISAALSTRRARAKRGIPFFTSFIWYSALVCLTLTGSKLGGGSEKCKQVCFFAHLALTLYKFGCTRHRQNLKTAFFILLSALVCLTLTVSKLGGGSEKCKQVCFFTHLALTL